MPSFATVPIAAPAARQEPIAIRRIAVADLADVLKHGWDDFLTIPTQLVFLCILYPVVGLVAARAAVGDQFVVPLLFPLVAGIALLGPVLAVGVYELSRRREQHLSVSWLNAFDVLRSPAIFPIGFVGVMLLAIFFAWMVVATIIFNLTVGRADPASMGDFVHQVLHSPAGWQMIVWGNITGFVFAVVVLALTVVSIPMLLDAKTLSPAVAIRTSIRAVAANPLPMAAWGCLVAGILLLGCVPLFIGLAVAMPVLGHATWHLYRKVVV